MIIRVKEVDTPKTDFSHEIIQKGSYLSLSYRPVTVPTVPGLFLCFSLCVKRSYYPKDFSFKKRGCLETFSSKI